MSEREREGGGGGGEEGRVGRESGRGRGNIASTRARNVKVVGTRQLVKTLRMPLIVKCVLEQ